ncbi:[acyl-carrier-protein] S-malonyltransferase [Tilletia horrida]|nr:[acyl-carrier-protein] S-malonyltransferase [Tilletia horrida]
MLAASARPTAALRSYSSSQAAASASSASFHVWSPAPATAPSSSPSASSPSPSCTAPSSSSRSSTVRGRAAHKDRSSTGQTQRRYAQTYAAHPPKAASNAAAASAGSSRHSVALAAGNTLPTASPPLFSSPTSKTTSFGAGKKTSPPIIPSALSIAQQSRWLRASPLTRSSPHPSTSPSSPQSASNPSDPKITLISTQFNAISGDDQDDDSQWAFGGGSSSRGGPISSAEHASDPASSRHRQRRAGAEPVIVGSAGKGAISGYGRRPRPEGGEAPRGQTTARGDYQSAQSIWRINFGAGAGSPPENAHNAAATARAEEDERIASQYVHKYSPSTRSSKALAQHTYFSGSGAPNVGNTPALTFPPNSDDIYRQSFRGADAARGTKAAHIIPPVTSQPSPSDGAHRGNVGEGAPLSSSRHPLLLPKPTALILPGQGSQFVGMSKDLYRSFRAARTIWCEAEEALMASADSYLREFDSKRDVGVDFGWVNGIGGEARSGSRRDFEEALEVSRKWDPRLGFGATGTAIARRRRGYLRDLVFSGDQLELTKAENASVSTFTCSMAFLATLKRDFDIDLIKAHVAFAAGHGATGTHSALCASGVLQLTDGVRFLRHRGLISSKFLNEDPRLFPAGCDRPRSVFQTWAFANASTEPEGLTDDEFAQQSAVRPHWKRTIMCGVVVRPGQLPRMIREIKTIKEAIEKGQIAGMERDEFVDIANYNGDRQIVLGGTKGAVDYACERVRSKGLGARAVNLPTSGPYHTSMMKGAQDLLLPAINALPLRPPAIVNAPKPDEPQPRWMPRVAKPPEPGTPALRVISSMDPAGPALDKASVIRAELRRTMATPVQWAGSVRRLIEEEGVRRFVCIGPGRACAHLLSRELAEYERAHPVPPPLPEALAKDTESELAAATLAAAKGGWGFEVWSIATVEDVELLGELMASLRPEATRGLSLLSVQRPAHGSDLYTHEEMMAI